MLYLVTVTDNDVLRSRNFYLDFHSWITALPNFRNITAGSNSDTISSPVKGTIPLCRTAATTLRRSRRLRACESHGEVRSVKSLGIGLDHYRLYRVSYWLGIFMTEYSIQVDNSGILERILVWVSCFLETNLMVAEILRMTTALAWGYVV